MAEPQPNNVTEGADVEDDVQVTAKSAEDRKAAAAMAKLDAAQNDEGSATKEVDQEAMSKAMGALAGAKQEEKKKDAKKAVKLDQAELAFVVRWSPCVLSLRLFSDSHPASCRWTNSTCRSLRLQNCLKRTTVTSWRP